MTSEPGSIHAAEDTAQPEAGPSRIQYPPTAAQRGGRENESGVIGVPSFNSSSSLFWRGKEGKGSAGQEQSNDVMEDKVEEQQDPLMEDALRSLPLARERQPSRTTQDDLPSSSKGRRLSAASLAHRSIPAQLAPSIASSKSLVGGWKDWLTAKSNKDSTSKKAEASKRLDRRLKKAEKKSKQRKERAARRSFSISSEGRDSDEDIVLTMDQAEKRPSLDVPPPNETTANALSQVAGLRKPKLHFAPEERKVKRKDLPIDYEQGELYRGIDDYVKAARNRRRNVKKQDRKKGSKASSRGSRSSVSKSSMSSGDSSSSSSSSDGNISSGSSSSSASGRLTMARLRAFFGDSSSSSNSSSSSFKSSSDSSAGSNRNSDSSSSSSTSSRSFHLFRRRRASRGDSASETDSFQPGTPRTPALSFHIKGGAQRRRRRKAVKRYRAQREKLIEEGKIPPRPSRKARRKAELARAQAGGVTEYILFTPIALTTSDFAQKHHHHHHQQSHLSAVSDQQIESNNPSPAPNRVLQSTAFAPVRNRLHALRRHRRQIENAAGDIGLAEGEQANVDSVFEEDKVDRDDLKKDTKPKERSMADELDFEDGDLALPPPAIDLPSKDGSLKSTSTIRRRKERKKSDWHMSDIPLTPHIQMATDFARGFEVGSPRKATKFAPILNTHKEQGALPSFRSPGHTPESNSEGQSSSVNTKVPNGLASPSDGGAHAAWWLDINCPTYRDMTELSKMFPLHPLTVEDILQQDTREKVEMFESLNYYFVVIRAIDEKYFKYTSAATVKEQPTKSDAEVDDGDVNLEHLPKSIEDEDEIEMTELKRTPSFKKPRVDIIEGVGGKEGVEGIGVGAVNLYLIVFSHGVLSFHFEDISNHTNRVRSRLLDVTQPVELTSDWVAHGLFDSIVDAFFPLLSFLMTEVEEIEKLTSEPLPQSRQKRKKKNLIVGLEADGVMGGVHSLPVAYLHEKEERLVLRPLPQITLPAMATYLLPSILLSRKHCVKRNVVDENAPQRPRSFIQRIFGINRKRSPATAFLSDNARDQSTMLRRITDIHKIVTGLSRLLTPKNDSVRGLRKRLTDFRGSSSSMTEMTMYMGDVHDHIVSLLSHLSSSDNRLGDIHFLYLSSIRINNNRVSHSTDEILVILATITVTILATIYVISIFSLNVRLPHNIRPGTDTEQREGVPSVHHWFGGVVAAACCVPPLIYYRTRRWIQQAKKRSEARRAVR
ncbi:hypothetical protein CBS101457_000845 [Exobasidium rhododendri]|nr:hypothetical protein CBS101457_000845 [Exobasidium rhododendri]